MEIVLDFSMFWRPALAVLLTFVIANLLKAFTEWRRSGRFVFRGNGGMPSSHSASVSGLAMTVLIESGPSLLFLVSLVFAFIVVSDAVGVRRETAKHSAFLNGLVKHDTFKEVGHEPIEAFVGVLIGVVVPILVYSFL